MLCLRCASIWLACWAEAVYVGSRFFSSTYIVLSGDNVLGWSKTHSAQSPAVQPDKSAECHLQALHELMRVSVNIALPYSMLTCSASHSPVYTDCSSTRC